MKYCILDCFVDEPACFGVPPFVSPYPRYICGALIHGGVNPEDIVYLTIDALRQNEFRLTEEFGCVLVIGGAVVPGKYLGAKIGTVAEIQKILSSNPKHNFVLGGPAAAALTMQKGANRAKIIIGDIEQYAFNLACGQSPPEDGRRNAKDISRWAVLGAPIVKSHPNFPDIICEIETYRGCPREKHCSFCSEGLFVGADMRQTEDILSEIDELVKCGVQRFRIGRQADILEYGTRMDEWAKGFPMPNPSAVKELFAELGARREGGGIKLLNIDNVNPGTIAAFPKESETMLAAIAAAVSSGDTAALGVESFDANVAARNNLKVTADEALFAVSLINAVCGYKKDGLPALLPGINLIQGLAGETPETFAINFRALAEMADKGLLLKRINIRKHLPFPGTSLAAAGIKSSGKLINRFEYYRARIRREIDAFMLKQIYPAGTILPDVKIAEHREGYSLGKQLASYSITLVFPEIYGKEIISAAVCGHRERSLEAVKLPINVNALSQKGLEFIPGISKRTAGDIIIERPFADISSFRKFLDERQITVSAPILDLCVTED